jgi:hypothetical protein
MVDSALPVVWSEVRHLARCEDPHKELRGLTTAAMADQEKERSDGNFRADGERNR